MGHHHHVVVAVQNQKRMCFSAAGSKAEILSKVTAMPVTPELRQQAVDAIKRFDPSAAILYVIIEDGKCTVREVPWSVFTKNLEKTENAAQLQD
jgi:hypothetical protein